MKRNIFVCLVSGVLIGGSLGTPAMAQPPEPQMCEVTVGAEWTAARRQADPAGFFQAVLARLQAEAAEVEQARESLTQDLDRQSRKIDAKVALWNKARAVSDRFRAAYRRGVRNGVWPVSIGGEEYPEGQLASQVSLLMKEAEALADSVAKMRQVRDETEAQLEQLTARAQVVDAQISMAQTKFELWRASRLESHGEQLLALLDRLIIRRPPLVIEVEYRGDDGFPIIPRETIRTHRNGPALGSYFENAGQGKPQEQITVDPMIPNQRPIQVQQTRLVK
jgi:hypothetical protein